MKKNLQNHQIGREELAAWEEELSQNIYLNNENFRHTLSFHMSGNFSDIDRKLTVFGEIVVSKVIPLVRENNLSANLPVLIAMMPSVKKLTKSCITLLTRPSAT